MPSYDNTLLSTVKQKGNQSNGNYQQYILTLLLISPYKKEIYIKKTKSCDFEHAKYFGHALCGNKYVVPSGP